MERLVPDGHTFINFSHCCGDSHYTYQVPVAFTKLKFLRCVSRERCSIWLQGEESGKERNESLFCFGF